MATYVSLIKWTDQGARNVQETVQRARAFRSDLERRGAKLLSIYWTQGQYDIVSTLEAPDDQTVTAAVCALGGMGNVRTETVRAFDEGEMASILRQM
jgi:uncharacterized protein with GYD domain